MKSSSRVGGRDRAGATLADAGERAGPAAVASEPANDGDDALIAQALALYVASLDAAGQRRLAPEYLGSAVQHLVTLMSPDGCLRFDATAAT